MGVTLDIALGSSCNSLFFLSLNFTMDSIGKLKTLSYFLFFVCIILAVQLNSYKKQNKPLKDQKLLVTAQKLTAESHMSTCTKEKTNLETSMATCKGELEGLRTARDEVEKNKVGAEQALNNFQQQPKIKTN